VPGRVFTANHVSPRLANGLKLGRLFRLFLVGSPGKPFDLPVLLNLPTQARRAVRVRAKEIDLPNGNSSLASVIGRPRLFIKRSRRRSDHTD